MDLIGEAAAALSETETKIQHLIEEGLRRKRYEDVARLAELAAGVSGIMPMSQRRDSEKNGVERDVSRLEATREPVRRNGNGRPAAEVDVRVPSNGYPRFERDGSKLLKIGWSEKESRSYEHRAPREAALVVFEKIKTFAQRGRVFDVGKISRVQDGAGKEIPTYQTYLVLAWLREVGLVERKGKDGYVIRRAALDPNTFDDLWSQLPERR